MTNNIQVWSILTFAGPSGTQTVKVPVVKMQAKFLQIQFLELSFWLFPEPLSFSLFVLFLSLPVALEWTIRQQGFPPVGSLMDEGLCIITSQWHIPNPLFSSALWYYSSVFSSLLFPCPLFCLSRYSFFFSYLHLSKHLFCPLVSLSPLFLFSCPPLPSSSSQHTGNKQLRSCGYLRH